MQKQFYICLLFFNYIYSQENNLDPCTSDSECPELACAEIIYKIGSSD